MQFDNSKPIYAQITDVLKSHMITGTWKSGDKVPAVRDLALEMGVNPNTMQRALGFLEQEGLLHAERTSGRFVTENLEVLNKMKQDVLTTELTQFFKRLAAMGFTEQEIKDLVQSYTASSGEGGDTV